MVFSHAYCSCPSCTPSRGSVLTGRNGYELEEGAVLWAYLPEKFEVYPEIFGKNGYLTGFTGKGWGPGDLIVPKRSENPAGKEYNKLKNKVQFPFGEVTGISKYDYFNNFKQFLSDRKANQPFCFWYGALEPHRPYDDGTGLLSGKDPSKIKVPDFWPDTKGVRGEILDYLLEIEWYDAHLLKMMNHLDSIGELDNTIVVMTSDNGIPFPRAKARLYEYGIHLPLAIRWGKASTRVIDDFVSFTDFAPTFLEAANIPVPKTMTGKSFYDLLKSKKSGRIDPKRNSIIAYKERHGWVQPNGQCNPSRVYRKDNWSLIWNIFPDMWPAGHPDPIYNAGMWPYAEAGFGPVFRDILMQKNKKGPVDYFNLCFGKVPEYELYNLDTDPYQLKNLAEDANYSKVMVKLTKEMKAKLAETNDPRVTGKGIEHFTNAPCIYSHAIESGFIEPAVWDKMSYEEQQKLLKVKLKEIETVKANLKKYYGE
jgi:uncharacterized sulfatase